MFRKRTEWIIISLRMDIKYIATLCKEANCFLFFVINDMFCEIKQICDLKKLIVLISY